MQKINITEFHLETPSQNDVSHYVDVLYNIIQKNPKITIRVRGAFKFNKVCMSLSVLRIKYNVPISLDYELCEKENICSLNVEVGNFFSSIS